MTTTQRVDFDEVRASVKMDSLIDYLALTGLRKKSDRQWKGNCPFCKSKYCFVITIDGGRDQMGAFNCFACTAGGDQLELVSLVRGNSRKDKQGVLAAARELHAHFLATSSGNTSSDTSPQPKPQAEKKGAFDAEKYLKTLEPEHEAVSKLGVSAETLREWKAGYSASGVNRGRLALPITTTDGTIVGYMGMTLVGEEPPLKFHGLNPAEYLFGADRVKEGELTVVRDAVAVLTAAENGVDNCVCFLTEALCVEQFEVLVALMHARGITSVSIF